LTYLKEPCDVVGVFQSLQGKRLDLFFAVYFIPHHKQFGIVFVVVESFRQPVVFDILSKIGSTSKLS
jgi:hypothetical protein